MPSSETVQIEPDIKQGSTAFSILLLSVFALMLGIGLQNTLLGVRAGLGDFSSVAVGVIMACYFIGFVAGSMYCPTLIERVGHIRTFSALATIASAAAVVHSLYVEPILWGTLRLLTGFCIAGLYLIVESWVNGIAGNAQRGVMLSGYFFVNLGAVAIGQQLLNVADPASFELFVYASVLVSIAIVPVALTRAAAPAPTRAPNFRFASLLRISPYALFGAMAAGLANGAFWGLAPLYGVQTGLAPDAIAMLMTAIILGGAALQIPLGKLSDKVDRRIVMSIANLILAALALWMSVAGFGQGVGGLLLAALFGGLLLSQYSLCLAHANDFVVDGDFVQLASAMLLVFGAAAAAGPLLGSVAMTIFGPPAFFWTVGTVSAVSALYAMWRMRQAPAPRSEGSSDFVPATAALSGSVLPPTDESFEGMESDGDITVGDHVDESRRPLTEQAA